MSKRITAVQKEINAAKTYPATEAIELAKKTASTKFVGNIEVHVRLGIDAKKTEQSVRGTLNLPHGTGKTKKIAAFVTEAREKEAKDAGAAIAGGDDLIKKIKETGVIDFEVAIAEPAMMPKLAAVAKILGPKGLMPNPKAGTVAADVGKAIKEYASGKMEFKNDESGNIHMILGKSNFPTEQIEQNYQAFVQALKASKPAELKKEFIQGAFIHSTMSPSIKVKI